MIKPERNPAYAEYIQSHGWAEKKQARMKLDGDHCQGCQARENLQVHHITYARLYRERMSDLVTVCTRCHRLIHRIYKPMTGRSLASVTFRVLKQMKPRETTEFTRIELPLVMPKKDKRGNYRT